MSGKMRLMLALAFIGAVAFAAAAWGDHAAGPKEGPSLRGEEKKDDERRGERRHRRGHVGRRMVHGEFKVQTRDGGFATVVIDTGEVTAVDAEDHTLTLRRADGETVTVTADEDTKIGKDRHRAHLGDIEAGDRVRVVQADEGEGFHVRRIMAHSPEAETGRAA